MLITHFSYSMIMIDFEGRSAELGFAIDSFDMTMNFCCVLIVAIRVGLEFKLRRQVTKILIADVLIALTCLGGIIYEAVIAEDFRRFMEAETLPANVIRTFKCFKFFLLFAERKYYWKKLHNLIMVLADSLSGVLRIFCLWFLIILVFAMSTCPFSLMRILPPSTWWPTMAKTKMIKNQRQKMRSTPESESARIMIRSCSFFQ